MVVGKVAEIKDREAIKVVETTSKTVLSNKLPSNKLPSNKLPSNRPPSKAVLPQMGISMTKTTYHSRVTLKMSVVLMRSAQFL